MNDKSKEPVPPTAEQMKAAMAMTKRLRIVFKSHVTNIDANGFPQQVPNAVELDAPEAFDLALSAQSVKATGFFCNGHLYIPHENIEMMYLYSVGTDPGYLNPQRSKMN